MSEQNKNSKGANNMSHGTRDYSEKRDFIRMQVSTPASLIYNGESFNAVCVDLSSNGCQIESSQSFEVNSDVQVMINSGGGDTPPLQADGTILRVNKQANNVYSYGIAIKGFH